MGFAQPRAASRKAVESAQLRREGMQGLGGPSVAVMGMAYRYATNDDINLDPARNTLAGSLARLSQLPSNYQLQRENSSVSGSVSALWPVYMGGFTWPVEALPELLQWLRWLSPSMAGIASWTAVLWLGSRASPQTGPAEKS